MTWRVVGLGTVLQALAFPALWPAYAEAQARGDVAWIRQTSAIAMRTTIALNVVWAGFLLAFGRLGIRLWAGPAAVPPFLLLSMMAVWSVIAGFMTAQSCLLGALNRTRVQAIASVLAAVVNIALSIVLVAHRRGRCDSGNHPLLPCGTGRPSEFRGASGASQPGA